MMHINFIITALFLQYFGTTTCSLISVSKDFITYSIDENENLERALGYNEDSIDNFTVIAGRRGYYTETHTVVTEDGYILRMFRIPRGKNCNGPVTSKPILMLHGFLDSSDTTIIAGPGVALGYILADSCYDVWCGNNRGNRYSRRHVTLDPDRDGSYWDFTFDEIGIYDLPAMIDYIIEETGSEMINFIGHSQGTTAFFILASTRTEYNSKIQLSINLGPAAWLYELYNPPLRSLAPATLNIKKALDLVGLKEILGSKQATATFIQALCQFLPKIGCGPILQNLFGHDPRYTNTETIRAVTGHFPSGSSANNLAHFGQAIMVDRFRRYDYGEERNQMVYGSSEPPDFNVTLISTQVALICGKQDWFISLKDVAKLRARLTNLVQYTVLEPDNWSHLDFVLGDRIPINLSPEVLDLLDNYG